jgi:hypothetical protein
MIKKFLIPAALAAVALIGASSAARAAEAFTTTNANVRSGPGIHYSVIGTLSAGTRVQLDYCRSGWCQIEQGRLHGWTSESLLDKSRASVVIVPPIFIHPPHHHHKPWPPKPHKPWPPKPWPPKPHKPQCKIAPGYPCP